MPKLCSYKDDYKAMNLNSTQTNAAIDVNKRGKD